MERGIGTSSGGVDDEAYSGFAAVGALDLETDWRLRWL
jgi:hypothetical protein